MVILSFKVILYRMFYQKNLANMEDVLWKRVYTMLHQCITVFCNFF